MRIKNIEAVMAVRNNDDKMTAKTFVPRYVVFTALCFMVFLLLMQVYKAVFYGYFSAQFASARRRKSVMR